MRKILLLILIALTTLSINCQDDGNIYQHQQEAMKWVTIDNEHIGRLYIPSVNIDVGLYYETDYNKWQSVTDRNDTACYFSNRDGCHIIADHNNQSFSALKNVNVGDTLYILYGNKYDIYECVAAFDAHNTGYEIIDNDGKDIQDTYDFICYTCIDSWRNISVVALEKKEIK